MQQEIWFQKYKILGLLGRGGSAKVYLAEHILLNSYRAIKVISKNNPLYHQQHKEAFILKSLKHSCIPIIYDIEEDEEGSYIVEQYLEGETLKNYVETKGPLPDDRIINLGVQICDLIHYLHSIPRPLLYIDLKPDNLILSGNALKLIDFGSAIYQDELPEEHEYTATIGYAAPELYRQNRIDERCDVYGIGMLLYYMATGKAIKNKPAQIDHIDQVGSCSKRLKNIINKSLKFHPSQRFTTVARLSKQLSALLQKNQLQTDKKLSLTIAIAGSQPRIGVTHFAFRLCNYISYHRRTCLYEEYNNSGCVHAIKSCYENGCTHLGIYELEGIKMCSFELGRTEDVRDYEVVVKDYGCLTNDTLDDFLQAEVKLLMMGAKDWELEASEQLLNTVTEYKDIFYLFNFLNGKQFLKVTKSMSSRVCLRIPYEPDPYARITAKNGLDLFDDLLQPFLNSGKESNNET